MWYTDQSGAAGKASDILILCEGGHHRGEYGSEGWAVFAQLEPTSDYL